MKLLPAEPLRNYVRWLVICGATVNEIAERVGVDRRQVFRLLDEHRGAIGARLADRWACRLNLHPIDLWGDDWLALAEPEEVAA